MSPSTSPGEHLRVARELLEGLQSVTSDPGGLAEVRAAAATAHAVLALAEQVSKLESAFRGR